MINKTILPNGIRVVSEYIPYVKSISLGIWIGTGSRFEDDHNHGISHFIEHMMFKGTKNRSAKDIAESIDSVGGHLNAFTAKEYTCYYIKILDSHSDLAMDVLSDMLLNSQFDSDHIEKEKQVVLEEVKMYEDSPDELVHDIYLENVWKEHQLGRNILGTKDSIVNFEKDLILEYIKDFYTGDNVAIVCAGNIEHEKLVELAKKYFSDFSGKKKEKEIIAPNFTKVKSFHYKDTEQTHLCLGTIGVDQNSPDLYAIYLLNNILGGGVSSRLFQSIREERGLAYSVYSYQTNYKDCGLFSVYAGTSKDNTKQVIDLILQNIKDLKNYNITEKELRTAKEQIKGAMMLGLEGSSSRMSRLGKLEITLGKFVSLDEIVEEIEKVSLDKIANIIEKIFRKDLISFTSLGPIQETDIENIDCI
ncbi:insulinase family protein [Selenomonadales bacterium OttesenSCG-928-I06]|nr:insulinase family protein [Selenomonadales bacterium OttesenSCG-928-I06]